MKIQRIVIHCSDSPDNLDDIGVKQIRAWHTMPPPQGRGWSEIGYHYVVRRDCVVEVGRYEDGDSVLEGREIGAHVSGHNSDSIAVCWVGRAITPDQERALLRHVVFLTNIYQVPASRVFGHKELAPGKTCPNLDMKRFRNSLIALGAWAPT